MVSRKLAIELTSTERKTIMFDKRWNAKVQTNFTDCETVLDRGYLQVLGHRGWYDIRRNGKTKIWKRNPHKASIPVKLGLRECFRLEFDNLAGGCCETLRVRPNNFDPRKRGQ